MSQIRAVANAQARPRKRVTYISTPTGRNMRRALDMVRNDPGAAMTMISGSLGVGKTQELHELCFAEGYQAVYVSVARGEGNPANIAANVMAMFGVQTNGKSLSLMRTLLEQYIGEGRVLLVDEAQYLTDAGLEWLRAASENGQFDLIFAGDTSLEPRIRNLPQLYRRMLRPVVVHGISRADVEAFVAASAYAQEPEAVDLLLAVAKVRRGNFGNIENVLRLASLFAGDGTSNLEHLKAAISDLHLQKWRAMT